MHQKTFRYKRRPARLPRLSRQSFSRISSAAPPSRWPMAGGNSTGRCLDPSQLSPCANQTLATLHQTIQLGIWRVNALLLGSAILAGFMVVIGVYAQRYRHRRSTRLIFLAATTLFLSIVSSVSSSNNISNYIMMTPWYRLSVVARCIPGLGTPGHFTLVLIWAFLAQIIMVNSSVVVALSDREGQSKGLSFELLVQGVSTLFIGLAYLVGFISADDSYIAGLISSFDNLGPFIFFYVPFAVISAKIGLKYYAFKKAQQSFAFARNPCLIFGYMQQIPLQQASQHGGPTVGEVPADDACPPPLLVMGEETRPVENQPNGHLFKDDSGTDIGLVTLDKVWHQLDGMLPLSTPQQLKDLCLSFASFKLLRCRFARYELTNARSKATFNFFWSMLLKYDGHDRIFGVIADEISFVYDYCYLSLPVSYSKFWLPIIGIFISLLSVGYSSMVAAWTSVGISKIGNDQRSQIYCDLWCVSNETLVKRITSEGDVTSVVGKQGFGSIWFDFAWLIILSVSVIVVEVREMASYICSNWTKVTLICHLVSRAPSRHCLGMRKWVVGILLKCRCKLLKHWDEKIDQCSVLTVHPRTTLFVRHLLRLSDKKTKVKVTSSVKACIIEALQRSNSNKRQLSNGAASLRRSQAGKSFLWACHAGKGTSDTILTWHIATSVLEVRHPFEQPLISDLNKMVAIHLSQYCAYLVAWCPELLPDNDEWSKGLYKDVKKEAERALAGDHSMGSSSLAQEAKYQQLTEKLANSTQHEVLKNGVKLGKQLVELAAQGEEETVWKLLADLWSEMILFVAPSDNLKGHSEAIAQGGELITLLWVLLFHAGILSRPAGEDEDGAAAAASAGVV